MKENLLILGAGQYGCFVREIAEAMSCFETISFLDDSNPNAIGPLSDYISLTGEYTQAVVAIGHTPTRLLWLDRLQQAGYTVTTLVHPQAFVSPSAKLEAGSIVEPMAVVQSNAMVGKGCLVASGAVIKHDAVVGDGCYIDCNSVVAAGTKVPDGTRLMINTGTEEWK